VTFSDPPAQFTKEQVDGVLRDVQEQTALLVYLEQEVGRSKEYLSKVGFWVVVFSLSGSSLLNYQSSLIGCENERHDVGTFGC
jgi:hypothetical protein